MDSRLPEDEVYRSSRALGRSATLLRERRFAEAVQESLAGYEILSKQSVPAVCWLKDAQKDLAMAHAAEEGGAIQ